MSEILTPQQIRARLVESYTRSYAAAGIAIDRRALEAQVLADLLMVDAARSRGDLATAKKAEQQAASPRPRRDPLKEAEAKTGSKLLGANRDGATAYRPRVLNQNPQKFSERWGFACGRIKRITEGATPTLVNGTIDLRATCATATVPALALRYMEQWSYYVSRGQSPPSSGADHNPFRGMNDRDASRAFMRAVEDICDASTGAIGAWFVK